MRYQLSLDVPYCNTILEVFHLLKKHGAKIEDYEYEGPAGGNPCLLLSFETREKAHALLRECYPDDDDEFLIGRIECRST